MGRVYEQLSAMVRRARGPGAATASATDAGDPGALVEHRRASELKLGEGPTASSRLRVQATYASDSPEICQAVEALRRMRWEVTTTPGFEGLRVTPELQAAVEQLLPQLVSEQFGAASLWTPLSKHLRIQQSCSLLLDVAGWIICPELFPRPPSSLAHQAVLIELLSIVAAVAQHERGANEALEAKVAALLKAKGRDHAAAHAAAAGDGGAAAAAAAAAGIGMSARLDRRAAEAQAVSELGVMRRMTDEELFHVSSFNAMKALVGASSAADALGKSAEGAGRALAWLEARRGAASGGGGGGGGGGGAGHDAEDSERLAAAARCELRRRAAKLLAGASFRGGADVAEALAHVLSHAQLLHSAAAAPCSQGMPPLQLGAEGAAAGERNGAAANGADTAAVGMAERLLSLCGACWPNAGAGAAAAGERGACNGQQQQQERQWWQPADSSSSGSIDDGGEDLCPEMRAFVLETLCHALLLRFAAERGIAGVELRSDPESLVESADAFLELLQIYDCILAASDELLAARQRDADTAASGPPGGADDAAAGGGPLPSSCGAAGPRGGEPPAQERGAESELELLVARFVSRLRLLGSAAQSSASTAPPAAPAGSGSASASGGDVFGAAVMTREGCRHCAQWHADGRKPPQPGSGFYFRHLAWALLARHKPSAQLLYIGRGLCFHSGDRRVWAAINNSLQEGIINQATALEARLLDVDGRFDAGAGLSEAEGAERERLLPAYARALRERSLPFQMFHKALPTWLLLHALFPAGPLDRLSATSVLLSWMLPHSRAEVVAHALGGCDAAAAAGGLLWGAGDRLLEVPEVQQQRRQQQHEEAKRNKAAGGSSGRSGDGRDGGTDDAFQRASRALAALFLAPWHREVCRAAPQGAGYWDAAVRVRAMLSVLRDVPAVTAAAAAAGSPRAAIFTAAALAVMELSTGKPAVTSEALEFKTKFPGCGHCRRELSESAVCAHTVWERDGASCVWAALDGGGAVACPDCGVALYCSADCASQARTADHGPQACGLMRAAAACGGSGGGGAALVDAVFHGAWGFDEALLVESDDDAASVTAAQ
ncbi:hypothetical protein Rsub_07748 [Raphidocelis subcapitata]|uniref:Uncharacterized protein n=1 Tax=Raphidocelis subcapitata TaxID=307507 RepID=A0A2V0PBR4_9CHLO|nr:hypothetical protein Rsub_07748 [Raphidocelis subcapitata]|eukprot:GBF95320.1 hypothetical protein Rsub_07748 [Raphidocelis subcapitata]